MKEMQRLLKFSTECKKVSHISEELIGDLITGNFVEEPSVYQHLLCVGTKAGYQDEQGNLQVEYIKKLMTDVIGDAQKAEELAETCLKQQDTPEKTAFEVTKCVQQHSTIA